MLARCIRGSAALFLCALWLGFFAQGSRAEAPAAETPAAEAAAQGESGEEGLPPRTTLWDYVKILPIFLYTPETNLGFGAGLLLQFDMPGAKLSRRPSSITMGGLYTLENQVMAQFSPDLRFGRDDFVLKGDFVGARYPAKFFGIGNETHSEIFDTFTDCYFRGELDARGRPFREGHSLRPLFVGAHHVVWWNHMRKPRAGDEDHESVFASIDDPG